MCSKKHKKQHYTWGVRIFNEWVKARNSGSSHANICPDFCTRLLAGCICLGGKKIRWKCSTIRNILAALFRLLKENMGVKSASNFIDQGQREATV